MGIGHVVVNVSVLADDLADVIHCNFIHGLALRDSLLGLLDRIYVVLIKRLRRIIGSPWLFVELVEHIDILDFVGATHRLIVVGLRTEELLACGIAQGIDVGVGFEDIGSVAMSILAVLLDVELAILAALLQGILL